MQADREVSVITIIRLRLAGLLMSKPDNILRCSSEVIGGGLAQCSAVSLQPRAEP